MVGMLNKKKDTNRQRVYHSRYSHTPSRIDFMFEADKFFKGLKKQKTKQKTKQDTKKNINLKESSFNANPKIKNT